MPKYENIETVIDRFLDYVNDNRKVSLSKIASALAISSSQAERLATLLEQSGFVEIHYGISDVIVTSKKKEEVISSAKKEAAGQTAKSKAIEQSKEIEHEVLTAESLLKFFERDVARRIEIAEELLKNIENGDNLSQLDVETIEREVDLALGQLAAFSSEVKTLADIEEDFYCRLTEFKEKLHSLKRVKEVKQELSLLEKIIQLIKSFFANVKRKPKRVMHRKKLRNRQVGVTFVGQGGFQTVKKKSVKAKQS